MIINFFRINGNFSTQVYTESIFQFQRHLKRTVMPEDKSKHSKYEIIPQTLGHPVCLLYCLKCYHHLMIFPAELRSGTKFDTTSQ
jgi:hypothetical protein